MPNPTDEELIVLCAKGNTKAFDQLYNRYSAPLTNFICRITNDFARAEDIFQETFIRIIENVNKFNPNYKVSTWIYRIAINLSLNEKKRSKLQAAPVYISSEKDYNNIIYQASADDNPQENIELREQSEIFEKGLGKLSDSHRIAFIMKFHQELSYKDIAVITNTTIGTVKSRIHYAVKYLKEIMENSQ